MGLIMRLVIQKNVMGLSLGSWIGPVVEIKLGTN